MLMWFGTMSSTTPRPRSPRVWAIASKAAAEPISGLKLL
jgi:hypothetical protein